MKFTFRTTLGAVSFSAATLEGFDLGDGTVEYKSSMGRGLKELAPFFGKGGGIRVTFEGDSPQESGASWKDTRDERLCTCPVMNEHDEPCPLHNVLAPAPAPPVANGHPSCCALGAAALYPRWSGEKGGWFTYSGEICCVFCPFCGAKLPEVPR